MRILHTITILAFLILAHLSEAQPVFNISQHTAQQGQTVTVDVTVENFTNINAFQYVINWDLSVLEFQQVTNFNASADINISNFNTPNDDPNLEVVTVSVSSPDISGLTLADNTRLFSMEFEVIGDECSVSSLDFISTTQPFLQINVFQNDMDVTSSTVFNIGRVEVDGENCNGSGGDGDLELFATREFAGPGDMVCVGVGVRGFNDVASVQFSQNWNPDLLSYVELRNFNLPGMNASNFETGQTANGVLRFSYNPAGDAISVPDNTIIYEICYEVTGSIGQVANVNFSSTPVIIDVVVEVDGVAESVTPALSNGRVTIDGEFDGLTFVGEDVIGALGETVCMDITVRNFEDVTAFQGLRFEWDPNGLEFESFTTVDLPGNIETALNQVDQGIIPNTVWDDPSGNPVNLDNNAVLASICFIVIGECETSYEVSIVGGPNGIEVFDADFNPIPAVGVAGTIQVECDCNIDATVTNVSCFDGEDGAISLDLSALCTPFESLVWTSDATDIPDGTINPTGLAAGTYTVVVTTEDGVTELTITVSEPDDIVIENIDITLPDPPTSATGGIALTVSGGTGELSYAWSNGASGSEIDNLELGSYTVTITDENGCELIETISLCGSAFTVDVENVNCFGESTGSIMLIFEGNDSNLSFDWSCDEGNDSPIATGLSAGECILTITDNDQDCSFSLEFEITQPDAPLTLESSTVVDDDEGTDSGSISVSVSGGTPPYTYNWSPGDLPNAPNLQDIGGGAYTLEVVDANGCTLTETILVGGALELGANVIHVACRGEASGSISLNVSGGSGDYSYQWICDGGQSGTEFSISGVSAGTCRVLVTDNETGVQVEEEYVINEPETDLEFEIMSLECNEETNRADLTLVATGGVAPYSYSVGCVQFQSTNGFFGLFDGEEVVCVRDDAGCVREIEVEIPRCIFDDCFEGRLVITPNGDGLNDNLIIKCAQNTQNILRIFNRGGQQVYQEANYRNTWEGTSDSGSDLNEDTYLWVLEIIENGRVVDQFNGTVTILRELR